MIHLLNENEKMRLKKLEIDTPRTAKVFSHNGVLYDNIEGLDIIINEYINKRNKKYIGEDVSITKLESLKTLLIKQQFVNVLIYFIFNGSGKGDSECKSNAIMHYEDNNIKFIQCITHEEKMEYIKIIYKNIILSLRDKGMPTKISDYNKPWIFYDYKHKSKGSLHIRIN